MVAARQDRMLTRLASDWEVDEEEKGSKRGVRKKREVMLEEGSSLDPKLQQEKQHQEQKQQLLQEQEQQQQLQKQQERQQEQKQEQQRLQQQQQQQQEQQLQQQPGQEQENKQQLGHEVKFSKGGILLPDELAPVVDILRQLLKSLEHKLVYGGNDSKEVNEGHTFHDHDDKRVMQSQGDKSNQHPLQQALLAPSVDEESNAYHTFTLLKGLVVRHESDAENHSMSSTPAQDSTVSSTTKAVQTIPPSSSAVQTIPPSSATTEMPGVPAYLAMNVAGDKSYQPLGEISPPCPGLEDEPHVYHTFTLLKGLVVRHESDAENSSSAKLSIFPASLATETMQAFQTSKPSPFTSVEAASTPTPLTTSQVGPASSTVLLDSPPMQMLGSASGQAAWGKQFQQHTSAQLPINESPSNIWHEVGVIRNSNQESGVIGDQGSGVIGDVVKETSHFTSGGAPYHRSTHYQMREMCGAF
jgi:hypothetical protein